MLDLFNGAEFKMKNKFLNEFDCAIQAIAVLLTTSSPLSKSSSSLYELLGCNSIEDVRPEITIRVNTVNQLIKLEYPIIKSVSLLDVEEDIEQPGGLLVTLMILDSRNVPYQVGLEIF